MKKVDCKRIWVMAAVPAWLLAGCATTEVASVLPAPVQTMHAVGEVPKKVAPLPPPSALESQYGIQIAHVGLTASGGLVDLRFKILDAAKAGALLGNPANTPKLIVGDLPPLMPPHKAMHGARYGQGQTAYILYPNLRGAIKPGVEVMVALGDVRLGPVTAQ